MTPEVLKRAEYWKAAKYETPITKGKLASLVLDPELTFDYAIPQGWLDQYRDQMSELAGSCVTAYPKGSVFGEIVNLFTGEVYR